MRSLLCVVASIAGLLLLPTYAGAQANPGDITFTVPLNITQLFGDIVKVRVNCSVMSEAIVVNRVTGKGGVQGPGAVWKEQEFPVSGGKVVTTATIVVSVAGALADAAGKQAAYSCTLSGFSNAQQKWMPFNYAMGTAGGAVDLSATDPAFRLSPPGALGISGTFTW